MSGMTTANSDLLIRSQVWSSQLKDVLLDELLGTKYVMMLTEFPDGDTFNIPSVGEMEVRDYVEDTAVQYTALDTGNFQFQITEYVSSATYITDKNKQDMFYMDAIVSQFVPKQARAIMQRLENDIMNLANEQTLGSLNEINGAAHRWVAPAAGSGAMTVKDFAAARYALKKANVPDQNLVAIVDPSVEYTLNTIAQLVSLDSNPRWEGIVADGIASGPRFVKNVYGFDVYTSNYCADVASETIDSVVATDYKANMFFSATSDILPFIMAWRQMPQVESERNKDYQRDEYVTTARYGVALFRPENLVVVLSNPDVIS